MVCNVVCNYDHNSYTPFMMLSMTNYIPYLASLYKFGSDVEMVVTVHHCIHMQWYVRTYVAKYINLAHLTWHNQNHMNTCACLDC